MKIEPKLKITYPKIKINDNDDDIQNQMKINKTK